MYVGKDMSGLRFGSLTVVSEDTLGKGKGVGNGTWCV